MKKGVLVLMSVLFSASLGAESLYVNNLVSSAPRMEISFLAMPPATKKSDATVLADYTRDGVSVYLVDGGMPNCAALSALLDLRSSFLKEAGKESEIENPSYKMRFTNLITHSHPDHIGELVSNLYRNPYFEVTDVYLPEATALPTDGTYQNSHNSDVNGRVALLKEIEEHQSQASVRVIPFGKAETVAIPGGKIEIYGPETDWGAGDALAYIRDTYYGTAAPGKAFSDVPTAVLNSNCVWYRVVYQGRSVLFPGDVMKKKTRDDEPFDRMIDFYGAENLRSDIVKYPHHGILRNPAAPRLVRDLLADRKESYVVVTGAAAAQQSVPLLASSGVKVRDASRQTVRFTISSDGEISE